MVTKQATYQPSRLWLVIMIASSLLILLVARLIHIQVVQGAEFRAEADNNRYFTVHIPPERGVFLDRYGQPLVRNQRQYFVADDPQASHPQLLPVTREEALLLIATQPTQMHYGIQRQYLHPEALAHVIGYVGPVTAENLLADSSLAVSDLIGKAGLEQRYDQQLRGRAGSEVYEINALGKRQRLISQEPGKPGQNVLTTLDPFISELAIEALGELRGVVVVEDGKTGAILALVSTPGFNANILSQRYVDPVLEQQRQEQVQRYFTDPLKPFFNRAIGGLYPPGSVFKLVTAVGGLESGEIDADTTVVDEGVLKVGQYEYANWFYTQYGRTEGEIGLRRAIARSNDIFFYKVAEKLGPNRLAEYAQLFGFGKTTGIELGHEATGVVPTPEWKEQVIGEPWYLGNTFHMGIGQGDVSVSPLQVGQMTQALANHGSICTPTLIQQNTADCREMSIQEDHLKLVLNGMLDVCSVGGTAFPFFSYNAEYRSDGEGSNDPIEEIRSGAIACKTGTAEFGPADEQGYRDTHGWLTAVVGTRPVEVMAQTLLTEETATTSATAAAEATGATKVTATPEQVATDEESVWQRRYHQWLQHVADQPLPEELIITVLVESDDVEKFREGSYDAGPVVKQVIDGMHGKPPKLELTELETVNVPAGAAE